jgi:hypothetical protein
MLCSQFPTILSIFGEKMAFFLKNQRYDQILQKLGASLSKKRQKILQNFSAKILLKS